MLKKIITGFFVNALIAKLVAVTAILALCSIAYADKGVFNLQINTSAYIFTSEVISNEINQFMTYAKYI